MRTTSRRILSRASANQSPQTNSLPPFLQEIVTAVGDSSLLYTRTLAAYQPSERHQIVFFTCLDLYHQRGQVQIKGLKITIPTGNRRSSGRFDAALHARARGACQVVRIATAGPRARVSAPAPPACCPGIFVVLIMKSVYVHGTDYEDRLFS